MFLWSSSDSWLMTLDLLLVDFLSSFGLVFAGSQCQIIQAPTWHLNCFPQLSWCLTPLQASSWGMGQVYKVYQQILCDLKVVNIVSVTWRFWLDVLTIQLIRSSRSWVSYVSSVWAGSSSSTPLAHWLECHLDLTFLPHPFSQWHSPCKWSSSWVILPHILIQRSRMKFHARDSTCNNGQRVAAKMYQGLRKIMRAKSQIWDDSCSIDSCSINLCLMPHVAILFFPMSWWSMLCWSRAKFIDIACKKQPVNLA